MPCPSCFIPRICYSSHGAYAQSKLGLVLFTYYLQEQLTAGGFSVTVNAVDPGMVDTALYDNLWSLAQAMKKPVAKILFRVGVTAVILSPDLQNMRTQLLKDAQVRLVVNSKSGVGAASMCPCDEELSNSHHIPESHSQH